MDRIALEENPEFDYLATKGPTAVLAPNVG